MTEPINVPLELGVPLPTPYTYADLKSSVEAACATSVFLREHGAEYPQPSIADKEKAAVMFSEYAAGKKETSTRVDTKKLARETPQAIIYARGLLDEYGHKVVEDAQQIRHMVTTKLIAEAENADPRVRLKALELLGKISDVGLFSDKTEVTVTHQTSDELKDKLRTKLEKLINPKPLKTSTFSKQLEAKVTADDPDLDFSDVPLPDGVEGEYEEVPDDPER